MEENLNSLFLDCRHNRLMQLQRCAQVRVYVMKKLFLNNYKQNHGPWDNMKLLLIEQLFCYH